MRVITSTLSLLLLSSRVVNGYQFPLSIPFLSKFQVPIDPNVTTEEANNTHRIAIIGAGAGGSSAAFWLARVQNRSHELEMSIDVFEKEVYIGGRSAVIYPYNSKEYEPVELGASIFVQANKNLWRAMEEFNLTFAGFDGEDGEFGIWDGNEFRFRAQQKAGSFGWWDMIRLLWRYGIDAPRRSQALVKSFVDMFLALYEPTTPSWTNVTHISTYLGLDNLTIQTSKAYLDGQSINELYSSEMIEGMTRVNYGQNVDEIHALGGFVSQAANNASSAKGGNYQIFEQFLVRSGANVYLNTTVLSLTRNNNKWTLITNKGESRTYNSIILAAPYHATGIEITPALATPIPEQSYLHLHVTYLATSSATPNPQYFSLAQGTTSPTTILTTNDGFVNGGPKPEFNSLSYYGKTTGRGGRPDQYVVKIFSSKRMNDTWLHEMFGKVGWVYRKEWDAYPLLKPTDSFPPVRPEEGLYYVNSFEPYISTMETETISAQNVVELLINDVWGLNATLCSKEKNVSDPDNEKMKGWDC